MTPRDRIFATSTLASAVLPGLLILAQPLDESRASTGYLLGWCLATAVIVPSFLLMRAVMDTDNQLRFQQAFIGSMMGRMLIAIMAVAAVAVLMVDPPLKSFLLTFFVTYMLLSGIEVALLTSRGDSTSRGGSKGEPA